MQNWLSNFYIFSFQSSNFQFSPLTFNFCQFKAPLLLLLLLPLNLLNDIILHVVFFFFLKHVKGFAGVPAKPQCGAVGVKSHEIKLPRELLSCRSLHCRWAGCRFVQLSLLWREIASLAFPHEIQQNSIPKYIIYIYIFKLK